MKADPTFDLKQYLRVLRRRIWLLLIPVVVMTIVVGGGSLFMEDVYQVSSQVLVRPEMDAVSGLAVNSRMQEQIEAIMSGLMRPEGMQPVIERLRDAMPPGTTDNDAFTDFGKNLSLRKGMSGSDTVISVQYLGPKDYAIEVVNAFAEEIENQGTEQVSQTLLTTIEFVRESLTDYQGQLDLLSNEERELLRELEKELGGVAQVSAAVGLTKYVGDAMAQYDSEGRRLDAQIAGLQARLELIDRFLNGTDETLELRSLDPGSAQAIAALEQLLAQTKMNRVGLTMRYTEKHPLVQENERQAREIADQLRRVREDALRSTSDVSNPNFENAQLERIRTATELDDVRATRAVVAGRLERLRQFYYARVPDLEQRLSRILQQREILTGTHGSLAGRLDTLELNRKFEGVNTQRFVLRRAVNGPMQPIRPNRKKIAILGFIGGLFVGISFILLAEYLDHAVRSEMDLRRYVDAPILAVLPRAPR